MGKHAKALLCLAGLVLFVSVSATAKNVELELAFDNCTLDVEETGKKVLACPQGRYQVTGENIQINQDSVVLGHPRTLVQLDYFAPPGFVFRPASYNLEILPTGSFQNGDSCGLILESEFTSSPVKGVYRATLNGGNNGFEVRVLSVDWSSWTPSRRFSTVLDARLVDPGLGETCSFRGYRISGNLEEAPTSSPTTSSPSTAPSISPTDLPTTTSSPTSSPTKSPTRKTQPPEIPGGAGLWIGIASAGGVAAALGGVGAILLTQKKRNRLVEAEMLEAVAEARPAVGKRPSGIGGLLQAYVPFMRGSDGPWAESVEDTEGERRQSAILPRPEFIRQFTDRMDMLEVSSQRSRRSEFSQFDDSEDEEEDEAFDGFDIDDYGDDEEDEDEDESVHFGTNMSNASV